VGAPNTEFHLNSLEFLEFPRIHGIQGIQGNSREFYNEGV
jgi:hypothetical protein